ncbi:MAG: hypothetical protein IKN04_21150, partial [Clostridia bacterium]|nr:hypothetical protein [Clostridia bacterium]
NSLLIYEAFLFPPILCSNLLIRLLFSLVTEKDTLPFLYQRTFFSDLVISPFPHFFPLNHKKCKIFLIFFLPGVAQQREV